MVAGKEVGYQFALGDKALFIHLYLLYIIYTFISIIHYCITRDQHPCLARACQLNCAEQSQRSFEVTRALHE